MLERIDHINIVVRDLPAMTAFYRDVLGLRVTKEVIISGKWIAAVVGLEDVLADVVYLDMPGAGEGVAGPRIELIKYHSPAGAEPPGLDLPHTRGLRHMAFRVDAIDPMVASLKQRGVKFFSDVQRVPDSQVTYAGGVRKRLVYFQDPEGNLLELCEYKAGSC
jgi:glyoxylase I family protein